jgi:hypothetical protein
MTANIIQIMKHTVKDSVLAITTDHALYCCVAISHSSTLINHQFVPMYYLSEFTDWVAWNVDLHQ